MPREIDKQSLVALNLLFGGLVVLAPRNRSRPYGGQFAGTLKAGPHRIAGVCPAVSGCRSCCCATAASGTRAPGPKHTSAGFRPSASSRSIPSWPTSTRSRRATGSSAAARRSMSGSRTSRARMSSGRWSAGCARSAGSTRSPLWSSRSRSATSSALTVRRALVLAWAYTLPPPVRRDRHARADHQDPARATPDESSSKPPGTICAPHASARRSPPATRAYPTTSCRSPGAPSTACTAFTAACEHTRNHPTSPCARELACFMWAAATAA